jgi:hypothetical protein
MVIGINKICLYLVILIIKYNYGKAIRKIE